MFRGTFWTVTIKVLIITRPAKGSEIPISLVPGVLTGEQHVRSFPNLQVEWASATVLPLRYDGSSKSEWTELSNDGKADSLVLQMSMGDDDTSNQSKVARLLVSLLLYIKKGRYGIIVFHSGNVAFTSKNFELYYSTAFSKNLCKIIFSKIVRLSFVNPPGNKSWPGGSSDAYSLKPCVCALSHR